MTQQTYPIKCRIRASDGGGPTRVDVYDDIGAGDFFSEGVTAKSFAAQMAAVRGPLEIHINSGGGDVFDGVAIGNAIRKHKGTVTTVVDGIAASIASVIAQAGQDRVMEPGSMMMIHDASTLAWGDEAELLKTASVLGKNSDNIAAIYAERAGGTPQQWRDTMKQETWYTAEEAVAAGLADRVGDGDAELPVGMDIEAFSSVPGRIAARMRTMPQAKAPAIVDADGNHAQMSGTHAHSHPAYASQGGDTTHAHNHSHDGDANHHHSHADADGTQDHGGELGDAAFMHGDHKRVDPDGDGDCDACPDGDTDHDYWTQGGEQIKSLPGKPVPGDTAGVTIGDIADLIRQMLRDAASGVDSSDWDASRAWHNGASSDDPAAFYAGICAGQKDGDKSTQAAWALPYKYHPSDPPNAAGVKAALSRLPQAEDLTNAGEAKAKLQELMKKINPDYEPEDRTTTDLSGPDLEQFRAALRGATQL